MSDALRCLITSTPGSRPQRSRSLSRRPRLQVEPTYPVSFHQGSDKSRTVYTMGDAQRDIILEAAKLNTEDFLFLDELARTGAECFVYASAPGAIFQHCPLTRGVRGLPNDGTYSASVAAGTTVFWPRGDTASEAWLEETDFETYPILAHSIQNHSGLYSTLSHEMALGQGVAILAEAKNQFKNSGFEDDGTDIYNWVLELVGGGAAPAGVDRLNTEAADSWMGVPALQIWGTGATGNRWCAPAVDGSGHQHDEMFLSFGWRCDGVLLVEVDYNDGGGWGTLVTLDGGSGYYRGHHTISAIAGNIEIRWSLSSATYGEICAPQLILKDGGGDQNFYYPYLEGLGEDVCGEITACSLKYDIQAHAGMWPASPTDDSAIIVSALVMPLNKPSLMNQTYKIAELHHSLIGKEMGLHMNNSGGSLQLSLRSNATTICTTTVTGYTYGDTLAVAFGCGWNSGTATHFVYAVPVAAGGGTLSSDTDTTGTNFYTIYDELWVGCNHDGAQQGDLLVQDLNVWAGTITPCCQASEYVEYMGNSDNHMEHIETLGRLFFLQHKLTPSAFNRSLFDGPIICTGTDII